MGAGPEEIAHAVARLRAGGVVAFPTETVYGLGADALNPDAVARVFSLKGRPATNPLIVHVCDESMARRVAADGAWTRDAQALARAFWPGPLTIVVARAPGVPGIVTGGGPTVAVRCPDHHVTLALIEGFGGPLVGPSANPSGGVSPTTPDHVHAAFAPEDVLVLDGGACRGGIESTVVSLVGPEPAVLRRGPIGPDEIARVLGRPVASPAPGAAAPGDAPAPSPGMQPRHYAPRTRLILLPGADPGEAFAGRADRVVVLSIDAPAPRPGVTVIPMPRDAPGYAARLYAALREADTLGADLIAVQTPPGRGPLWDAIRDRLARAAEREPGAQLPP